MLEKMVYYDHVKFIHRIQRWFRKYINQDI